MAHGVYVSEQGSAISTPVAVETGIPFVIGLSPIQAADTPAAVGIPALCTNFAEFKSKFGWSEDWATYPLCEFAYSHFQLYNCQPAIFVNLLNPSTMKTAVAASDKDVADHKVTLVAGAIDDATLVVKAQAGNGDPLVKDTDYSVYYDDNGVMIVEVLSGGSAYSATKLNIAYSTVKPSEVTTTAVATGIETVDLCMSKIGMIPDMIVAPGFSQESAVAAVMAAKAGAINGLFRGKALVDINTTTAPTYDTVVAAKNGANMTSLDEIVCWPLFKLGDKVYHASTQIAGVIAATDGEWGAPHVSPSNKTLQADSLVDAAGNEINLTLAQANLVSGNGVVTGLNFMGGFKAWGNYTGCYPTNTDVKDYFIPVSRTFDWVANTLIQTFWSRLDEPMTRRLVDSILDTANIWMNGLTGSGYILGGYVEMSEAENPTTALMAGIVKLHVHITPPSPAQEIDFVLEYDASILESALAA